MEEAKKNAYLVAVHDRIRKLDALLSDPHIGLMSWSLAFGTHMQALSDLWNNDKEPSVYDLGRKD